MYLVVSTRDKVKDDAPTSKVTFSIISAYRVFRSVGFDDSR